jgi:hypothetical protein
MEFLLWFLYSFSSLKNAMSTRLTVKEVAHLASTLSVSESSFPLNLGKLGVSLSAPVTCVIVLVSTLSDFKMYYIIPFLTFVLLLSIIHVKALIINMRELTIKNITYFLDLSFPIFSLKWRRYK